MNCLSPASHSLIYTTNMADSGRKRMGRPRLYHDSASAKEKRESERVILKNKTRIYLMDEHERWTKIKTDNCLKSDREAAKHLIDSYKHAKAGTVLFVPTDSMEIPPSVTGTSTETNTYTHMPLSSMTSRLEEVDVERTHSASELSVQNTNNKRKLFKENIVSEPKPKKKKNPIFLRNVATQTKHRHGQKQVETGTQAALIQQAINTVSGTNKNALDSKDGEKSIVNMRRWRCIRSMLGCSKDTDVANVIMDWFVDTSPFMKLSKDNVTFDRAHVTDTAANNVSDTSDPYLLTMRVTWEQEQSIQSFCTLKGWKFDPIKPVDVLCMEDFPWQWQKVPPLGDPFKYEVPPPGQKPGQPSRNFKFQSYNPSPQQKVTKILPAPHKYVDPTLLSSPAGSGQNQAQTGQSVEGPLCMVQNEQGQMMFVRLPQQPAPSIQQTSLPLRVTQPTQAPTNNVYLKQKQATEASNVTLPQILHKNPIVDPRSKSSLVFNAPNISNKSSVTLSGGGSVSTVTLTNIPCNSPVMENMSTTVSVKQESPEVENSVPVTSVPVSVQQQGSVTSGTPGFCTSASSIVTKYKTTMEATTGSTEPGGTLVQQPVVVLFHGNPQVPAVSMCQSAASMNSGTSYFSGSTCLSSIKQEDPVQITTHANVMTALTHKVKHSLESKDEKSQLQVIQGHGSFMSVVPSLSGVTASEASVCLDNIKQEISTDVTSEQCPELPTLEQQVPVNTSMPSRCAESRLDKVKEEFPLPVTTDPSNLTSVSVPGAGLYHVVVKQEVEDMDIDSQ